MTSVLLLVRHIETGCLRAIENAAKTKILEMDFNVDIYHNPFHQFYSILPSVGPPLSLQFTSSALSMQSL